MNKLTISPERYNKVEEELERVELEFVELHRVMKETKGSKSKDWNPLLDQYLVLKQSITDLEEYLSQFEQDIYKNNF